MGAELHSYQTMFPRLVGAALAAKKRLPDAIAAKAAPTTLRNQWCLIPFFFLLPAITLAADLPWDKYPQDDGLVETYAWCSPCHSFTLVAQQGMSRDRWDETLVWMNEKQGMGVMPVELRKRILDYLAQAFPEEQLSPSDVIVGATLESLPDREGRNETFAFCSACHSMRLVAQQGLTRDGWEETLDWMTEDQGMADLSTELRQQILDYLVWAFPPERPNYQP